MSCDYYNYKLLEINHKKGRCYIELASKRCYHPEFNIDPDTDIEIKEKLEILKNKFIELSLIENKSILIYENNDFIDENYKEKYNQLIKKKINGELYDYRDEGLDLDNLNDIMRISLINHKYLT
jgi:hypothetical protein